MKKRILISVLTFLIVSNLSAQHKSGFILSFCVGISSPLSPQTFSDSYRAGANFGIGIGKTLGPNLILEGALNYHQFNFDGNGFQGTLENPDDVMIIESGGESMINFSGKARFIYPHKPDARAISYLFGAIGMNHISESRIIISRTDDDEIIPKNSETVLASELGLGVEFNLESSHLFLELGLNIGFNEDKEILFAPLRFGVAF